MLNSVKLTNFQRHRNLEVTFSAGLTALRGSNEAGKSTLLRGICYALFGVGALGASLDDTVTQGEAVNTLKAEVTFTADGVTYTVKRGKSGAELNYDGGIVTGQKEVTSFVCKLLKVDAAAAGRLMLSSQNEIRGALESGPKATTELIEKLAEFDQIDHLIDLMQEKLALGSTATAEAALKRAEETVESAAALALAPDTAGLERAVTDAELAHQAATASLAVARKWEAEAQEAHSAAREKAVARDALSREVDRASRARDKAQDLVKKLSEVKAPKGAAEAVEKLRADLDGAKDYAAVRALYAKAKPFLSPTTDGILYVGTYDELCGEIKVVGDKVQSLRVQAAKLEGDARLLQAQLTHGSCTFCGKDFSGVPEVAAKNAETQAKLDAVVAEQAEVKESLSTYSLMLANLTKSRADGQPRLDFLAANPTLVKASLDTVPPTLEWIGPDVSADAPDTARIRREMDELLVAQREYDTAQAQLATASTALDAAKLELQELTQRLSDTPEVTTAETQSALDAYRASTRSAEAHERAAKDHQLDAQRALKDAKDGHARALKSLEDAREVVRQRSAEIGALEFNNALLKKVKQARPLIADRLWNLVLRAVSTYFSEIRGTPSKVTKGSDGFMVDGSTVATLSGSTLDALGLAIRVALVRTFLPSAPFLILDEPAAAMDADRTNNMLGFLSSAGFSQVLLCSHDHLSESVADNVIEL